MEFASRIRWILVIAAVVLFLVLIGWGLFSIATNIFRGGADDAEIAEQDRSFDITSTASAKLTVDGRIVADEEHRYYVIEVSENVVSMRVYQGYDGNVIRQVSNRNTPEAFDAFLSALDYENAADRRSGTTTEDDVEEQGVCPTGRRYILELDSEIRRWSTSCSRNQGTAGFDMGDVRRLFERQVPEFRELVRGTKL